MNCLNKQRKLETRQLTYEQLFDKVRDEIATVTGHDPEEVEPNSDLRADLNFDSLDGIELMFNLEDKFGFVAETKELTDLQTPHQVTEFVQNKVRKAR